MEEGRDLQLHIYLAALEQIFLPGSRIAGGGYYTIRGGRDRRNKGLYRASLGSYTGVSGRVSSNLSESEWLRVRAEMEARIWEFIDSARQGVFKVAPSAPEQTCGFCDYGAACRYEKFRIRGKREAAPSAGAPLES